MTGGGLQLLALGGSLCFSSRAKIRSEALLPLNKVP